MWNFFAFSLFHFLFFTFESAAVQLRIQRPLMTTNSDCGVNLINKRNERYTANITISGRVVSVALDTGSTDLWVMPPEGLPSFNDTSLSATLRYGDGSDYVKGEIGVGTFAISSYSVPLQAFLNVNMASQGENADFEEGTFGLWGLGFDTRGSSGVNDAVQAAYGPAATWGQSVLANIFAQNPSAANYIGISLSRTGDQEGTADASLTISEYDSDYQAVANSPKIPQTPLNSGSWTVVLDGLSINGQKIDWPSTMNAVPAGKNIIDLDTGTTNILMPARQLAAIYSAIPSAVLSPNSSIPSTKFSATNDVWVVPCNATPNVVASFGGQDFPIHPLDVTDMEIITSPDGRRKYTVCIGAFTDVGSIVQGRSDAIFGDSYLRNVFTVFDFGTGGAAQSDPFVQMLSQTDATKSSADLVSVRTAAMNKMPPEIAPVDLVKIFNGSEPSGYSGASAFDASTSFRPSMSTIVAITLVAGASLF